MKYSHRPFPYPLRVLGLMSGTSLDGLDFAGCVFDEENGYSIEHFETLPYDADMRKKLAGAHELSGLELVKLEHEFTVFTVRAVGNWLGRHSFKPNLIGAHGHTVFHQPERGFTLQILDGGKLAAQTGIPVVCDFRRGDVALGGQGAPLVPIGDALLFGEYAACLNLGGFANVSYETQGTRIAYDICPVNIVLNALAEKLGLPFDEGGRLARSGNHLPELATKLDRAEYYRQAPPKSLGREWVETHVHPLLDHERYDTADMLHTYTVHAAKILAGELERVPDPGEVLVTGGGAFNDFLMETTARFSRRSLRIPEKKLVEGKEALVFALLAKLRAEGEANVIGGVTGAYKDHVAGAYYWAGE